MQAASPLTTGLGETAQRSQSVVEILSALCGWIPLAGGVFLVLLYIGFYLANPALPGNNLAYPQGWWGWWDQSQYIESARAMRVFDLSPAKHWFPLGYSLLAAPFTGVLPMHPFFFVDLAGLLISYVAFQSFALRLGVARPWSALVFVLAAAADPRLAETWAVPWNTTVSAALIWMAFACMAAQLAVPSQALDRWRLFRFAVFGLLLGAIPLVRPTDALVAAICGATLVAAELWWKRARWQDAVALCLGGAVVLLPYALLYLRIYGPHLTGYMLQSRQLGFAYAQLPWKTYVLLVEPHPWFPNGVSLLARFPWIALTLAAVVPVLWRLRGPARLMAAMLAAAIAAYCILFFSYVDLLPTGLWLYGNVHYFQWVFPGVGLFAFLLLRELWSGDRRLAVGSLIVTLLVLSVRIEAVPAGDDIPARMLQFPGVTGGWADTYFAQAALQDAKGNLANIYDMRMLPDGEGSRAVALRREFSGPVQWVQGGKPNPFAAQGRPLRWGERLTLGYPCWLPPFPCQVLRPRS